LSDSDEDENIMSYSLKET